MAEQSAEDRRTRRTQAALNQAFIDLVLAMPYDAIQVASIADRAGVGRSTFYEHFSNKDDLLWKSLAGAFEALADTVGGGYDAERLEAWAGEFWTNRKVGRILLAGETRPFLVTQLAGLIEKRLPRGTALAPLAAAGLAELQLGLIHAWQTGRVAATPQAVADTLRRMASGAVASL